jgi:hypothetical protein
MSYPGIACRRWPGVHTTKHRRRASHACLVKYVKKGTLLVMEETLALCGPCKVAASGSFSSEVKSTRPITGAEHDRGELDADG